MKKFWFGLSGVAVFVVVVSVMKNKIEVMPADKPVANVGSAAAEGKMLVLEDKNQTLAIASVSENALPLAEAEVDYEEVEPSSSEDGGLLMVDFDQLQAIIPDNLYWKNAFPTNDPYELNEREREQEYWAAIRAKIDRKLASEYEIKRYYDYQTQISNDYIAFSSLLIEQYGDILSSEVVLQHKFAIDLHQQRLAELPDRAEHAIALREAKLAKSEEG